VVGVAAYYSLLRHLPASTFPILGHYIEKLRWCCGKVIFKKCGKMVNIEQGAHFGNGFNIEIGTHSSIGKNAKIPANIKIGNEVMMGNNVTIFSSSHIFDRTDISIQSQGSRSYPPFVIEDDVWIGQNVIILPKVGRIAKGTIVGAGAIVTKEFPPYSIIGGNPAKLIKTRKNDIQQNE
jgi:maltose O-acetyltransferase